MDLYEIIKDLNFTSVAWQIFTPLCFSLADFVTGYIQAVINHDVQSKKMRVGLLHKTLIFLVIILSFIVHLAFDLKYVSSFEVVSAFVAFTSSCFFFCLYLCSINGNNINIGKLEKSRA